MRGTSGIVNRLKTAIGASPPDPEASDPLGELRKAMWQLEKLYFGPGPLHDDSLLGQAIGDLAACERRMTQGERDGKR